MRLYRSILGGQVKKGYGGRGDLPPTGWIYRNRALAGRRYFKHGRGDRSVPLMDILEYS
jgi:hypothetical protein